MLRKCLMLLLLLGAMTLLRADISSTPSLEWLAVKTPLIVRGTVAKGEDFTKTDTPYYSFRRLTFTVLEVLKGKLAEKTLTVEACYDPQNVEEIGESAKGHPYLLFLHPDDRSHQYAVFGSRHVLDEPVLIDLQHPYQVYLANMTHLEKPEAILATVRKWTGWKPDPLLAHIPASKEPSESFIVPGDGSIRLQVWGAIQDDLFCGSVAFLQVPLSEDTRAMLLARSHLGDIRYASDAAHMLRYFPGADTVMQLRAMLTSPVTQPVGAVLTGTGYLMYPVRQAAYESLQALGEKVTAPVTSQRLTPQERLAEVKKSWTVYARELFGANSAVTAVQLASTPDGWQRSTGGDGFAVHITRTTGDTRMQLTLYIMPRDWAGKKHTGLQGATSAMYLGNESSDQLYFSSDVPVPMAELEKIKTRFSLVDSTG